MRTDTITLDLSPFIPSATVTVYYPDEIVYSGDCQYVFIEQNFGILGWTEVTATARIGGVELTAKSIAGNVAIDLTSTLRMFNAHTAILPLEIEVTADLLDSGQTAHDSGTINTSVEWLYGKTLSSRRHFTQRAIMTDEGGCFEFMPPCDGTMTVGGESREVYKGMPDWFCTECDTQAVFEIKQGWNCLQPLPWPWHCKEVSILAHTQVGKEDRIFHLTPAYTIDQFTYWQLLYTTDEWGQNRVDYDGWFAKINTYFSPDFLTADFSIYCGANFAILDSTMTEVDFARSIRYVHPGLYVTSPSITMQEWGSALGTFNGSDGKKYRVSHIDFESGTHVYVTPTDGGAEAKIDQTMTLRRGLFSLPTELYFAPTGWTIGNGSVSLEWTHGNIKLTWNGNETNDFVESIEGATLELPPQDSGWSSPLPTGTVSDAIFWPNLYNPAYMLLAYANGAAVDLTGQDTVSPYINAFIFIDYDQWGNQWGVSHAYTMRNIEWGHGGQSLAGTGTAYFGRDGVIYTHFAPCDGYWGSEDERSFVENISIAVQGLGSTKFATLSPYIGSVNTGVGTSPASLQAIWDALKGRDDFSEGGVCCTGGEEENGFNSGDLWCGEWNGDSVTYDIIVPCFEDCRDAMVHYYSIDGNWCQVSGKVVGRKTAATPQPYPMSGLNSFIQGRNISSIPLLAGNPPVEEEITIAFADIPPEAYPQDIMISPYVDVNGFEAYVVESDFVEDIENPKRDFTLTFKVLVK